MACAEAVKRAKMSVCSWGEVEFLVSETLALSRSQIDIWQIEGRQN